MGKFFKTTRINNHWHAAYITDVSQGATSKDNGHFHPILYFPDVPEQPPTQDEAGNVVSPGSPAQKGGFRVMPSDDGHTHELEEVVFGKKTDDGDEEKDSAKMVRALFKEAKAYESDFRKMASESMDFYNNKQWDSATVEKLKNMDRCYETINEINHKIKLLSGYQRQNRTDIKYIPVETGDQVTADILNNIAKNVCDQNNFTHLETLVFEDGVITGRGFYQIYIDYDKTIDIDKDGNLMGEVAIKRYSWDDVYLGPHDEYTLEDCEYLVKAKWYSKSKLKQMFPEKADDIKMEWSTIEEMAKDNVNSSVQSKNYSLDENEGNIGGNNFQYSTEFYDLAKKNILVMELERKRYVKLNMVVNTDDVQMFDKKMFDENFLTKVLTIPGFTSLTRVVTEYWVYKSSGGTLLDKQQSDFDGFSIVPYYVEKRGDQVYGKVENVKGEQRIVNKTASQTMDVINKTAAYGWFFDANTFTSDKEKRQFLNQSSSAGFAQEVANIGNLPQKVEGVKFPNEIVQVQMMHSEKLRELMNVNNELLGLNSQATSGVAIVEKKRQGLVGNEYIFDNLALAKRLFGRLLAQAIQKSHTPKHIYRILRSANSRTPIKIGGMPMDSYTEDQIVNLLNNLDISRFDVVVSESDHSPTMRQANFVAFSSLMQSGLPVPPNLLYELSDLPPDLKAQSIQFMQQQAESAQAEQKAKIDSENFKAKSGAMSKVQVAQIKAESDARDIQAMGYGNRKQNT